MAADSSSPRLASMAQRSHSRRCWHVANYHRLVVATLLTLLLLPILATLLYSLSSRWGATILPDGVTLNWYLQLWSEPRFLAAFARSLLLCIGTLVLAILVVVPAAFVVFYYYPKLDRWMNLLILLPFAMPPVVSSVGLLSLYADGPLPLIGTPWVLLGCYFTLILPFLYLTLANRLVHDFRPSAVTIAEDVSGMPGMPLTSSAMVTAVGRKSWMRRLASVR